MYLIAITNRGKDFFQMVAQALSDALGLNTLVLSYNQAEKSFHLTAFSCLICLVTRGAIRFEECPESINTNY